MAAYDLGELVWKITGNTEDIKKKLGETDKKISGVGKSASGVGKLLKTAFAVVGVAAVVRFGKSLINAASDAEETANKFGVVFDSVIDDANGLARSLQDQYGLASEESQRLLASTGDLLVGFGTAKDTALDLSYQVNSLAADLVSFTNYQGGVEGASRALTSALLGETEAAKSLGLALGETQLRQYAEAHGKVFKALTINEKAALRLELAISQSGSAIGDFQRSINSYANQSRIAEARTKDLQATLGKGLLPIATLAVKTFNENASSMQKAAEAFVDYVKSAEGAREIGDIIGSIAGAMKVLSIGAGEIIDELGKFIDILDDSTDGLSDIVSSSASASIASTVLAGAIQYASSFIKIFAVVIGGAVENIINMVRVIKESAGVISSFFSALLGEGSFDEFKKQASLAGDAYKTFGKGVIKNTKKAFSTAYNEVSNFGENTEKMSKRISSAFSDSQKDISKTVQSVLTAQQQAVKSQVQQQQQAAKAASELDKEYKKVIDSQSDFAKAFGEGSKESYKSFKEISKNIKDVLNTYKAATGEIVNLLGAIDNLNQVRADNKKNALDREMQAELEAAGLAEATAVQQAEQELARAEREGTDEEKRLAKNALKKAKIEEDYAKRKAKIDYEAALSSWEIKRAIAAIELVQAPLSAYVSTLSAPWPLNMILAPINAALAAATAGLQYKAVVESKPEPPSFATGGIVPGSSFSGDNVQANLNSGEMVLNNQQQARLFNIADGAGRGVNNLYRVVGTRESTFAEITQAIENGEILIPERALIRS